MSVFVGNLPPDSNDSELSEIFQKYGDLTIKFLGKFAFLDFASNSDAEKAIEQCNGMALRGNPLKVSWAREGGHQAEGQNGDLHRPRSRSRSRSPKRSFPAAEDLLSTPAQLQPQTAQADDGEGDAQAEDSKMDLDTQQPNDGQALLESSSSTVPQAMDIDDLPPLNAPQPPAVSLPEPATRVADELNNNEPLQVVQEFSPQSLPAQAPVSSQEPTPQRPPPLSDQQQPEKSEAEQDKQEPCPVIDEEEVKQPVVVGDEADQVGEGQEFTISDGSRFMMEKLNLKNEESSQVRCLSCNRKLQKKSIRSHISSKIHIKNKGNQGDLLQDKQLWH